MPPRQSGETRTDAVGESKRYLAKGDSGSSAGAKKDMVFWVDVQEGALCGGGNVVFRGTLYLILTSVHC